MTAQKCKHIAIIMDGNGRWAQERKHTRIFGHVKGARRVRDLTEECASLGLTALTLYTFSTENWNRPASEVRFLMKLLRRYLANERKRILKNNIQFRAIGDLQRVPEEVRKEVLDLVDASKDNSGMVLNLALSYGSKDEITRSMKKIAEKIVAGEISADEIDDSTINQHLYTSDLPDPDLLIRTGGVQRISNFLLWQCAYTELYFTECKWPDFTVPELHKAIETFEGRERRFGLTSKQLRLVK